MAFPRELPNNLLRKLPPRTEIETTAVLKAVVPAARAVAKLSGTVNILPRQELLINSLFLQEARLSSEIENIVTTNDDLYRAASDDLAQTNPHAKEVVRYREALQYGYEQLLKNRPLCTNLFSELARIIRRVDDGIRKMPGTKLADGRGGIIYTPPEGEDLIRELLANLEEYMHAPTGPDPLIRLAVAHYQFEAIHPFTDANGRTGRLVNSLYLVEQKLLDLPVLYLSHYILRTKGQYYELLRGVTEEQNWESWILYILNAVEKMAKWTVDRIHRIRHLMQSFEGQVKEQAPRAYDKEFIEILFCHPYCKIVFITRSGLWSRETAARHLRELVELGLLVGVKYGREWYFVNTALVDLLQEQYTDQEYNDALD